MLRDVPGGGSAGSISFTGWCQGVGGALAVIVLDICTVSLLLMMLVWLLVWLMLFMLLLLLLLLLLGGG